MKFFHSSNPSCVQKAIFLQQSLGTPFVQQQWQYTAEVSWLGINWGWGGGGREKKTVERQKLCVKNRKGNKTGARRGCSPWLHVTLQPPTALPTTAFLLHALQPSLMGLSKLRFGLNVSYLRAPRHKRMQYPQDNNFPSCPKIPSARTAQNKEKNHRFERQFRDPSEWDWTVQLNPLKKKTKIFFPCLL